MNYGLEIYNESDKLVINETYRNMVLRQKVTVTATRQLPSISGIYSSQYSAPASTFKSAMLAVRATLPEHRSKPISLRFTRGSWYVDVYTGGSNIAIDVDIFVFGYDESEYVSSTTDYGLLLYDSKGKLVFDSGKKYIKVIHFVYKDLYDETINGSVSTNNVYSATMNYTGDWAYMPVCSAYHDELFVFDEEDKWYGNRWVLDTYATVTGSQLRLDVKHSIDRSIQGNLSGMPAGYNYLNPLLNAFIIDVTNY